MIELHDTFNGWLISRHRTLTNAIKAQRRHLAALQRAHGKSSYLTYGFREADGTSCDPEEIMAIRMELDGNQ